jgi:PmbA protein
VTDQLARLGAIVEDARKAGADAVDALMIEGTSLGVARRMRELEDVERAETRDLGLRVFVGRRQAIVSTSDLSKESVGRLIDEALTSARSLPEDRFAGLAEPEQIATSVPDLGLADTAEPAVDVLEAMAADAEEAALSVEGVTNSEGAETSWSRTRASLVASNGFQGTYERTGYSLSCVAVAGSGTAMERDYDYRTTVRFSDLPKPEQLGHSAGERAVRRLNPQKIASKSMPVVFEPRLAASMIRHLAGAISGPAVARGTSFLKDKLGEQVFAKGVAIVDDPLRPAGLRSRPFDVEGIGPERRKLVDDGVLSTWLLDLASARQLGMAPTGHAARGVSSTPGPQLSNAWLEPGTLSPDELIRDIEEGFYVVEMLGMGVNPVTGDYSRGAAGFMIENGAITHPVSEVTVAGNLLKMFAALTPANDLEHRYGIDSPTIRIDGMTVAGR